MITIKRNRPVLFASLSAMLMVVTGCVNQELTGPAVAQEKNITTADKMIRWEHGLPDFAAKITDGGKGGEIVRVTTLESEGPGSLREAISVDGPKIIVFEVGGAIDLAGKNILISGSDITIAGQTAPSPGVSILRGGFVITGHDIIVQHLRVRPGDLDEAQRSGRDIDALTTMGAYNVVVDHNSLTWATDENLSASSKRFLGETHEDWRRNASRKILYSNNIIAEGLSNSTHAKGEHSKGSLIHDHVNDIVIYQNLYANNYERSPLFKGDVSGALVNNFIYNPGQRAVHYNLQSIEWEGHEPRVGEMDLISNVMKYGPSTQTGLPLLMLGGVGDLSVYDTDNIVVDRWGQPAPRRGSYETGPAKILDVKSSHLDLSGLEILQAEQVEDHVLRNAGARAWDRDMNDVRILADAAEGRGKIIDSQNEVGGYPEFKPTFRTFNAAEWNLETMSPKTQAVLSNTSKAQGT